MNRLGNMRPCTGYCQMIGAAAALLSIKGIQVIFNSPRWCAVIGERELMNAVKDYQERLFCSEARQKDILYGIEESLSASIAEAIANRMPKLLAILTSCSMSLIGDDILGICKKNKVDCPVLSIEAGGLTGSFTQGYQQAMIELLKQTNLKKTTRKNNKVNLLGICTCMPHWRGDLEEIKRILLLAGYEIGISLGSDGLELSDIKRLPEAALNVVLMPELGHEIASYLEMELGQKYLLLTWPYGFNNTLQWLQHIGEAIDLPPQLEEIKNEISLAEKDIFDEYFLLKHNFLDYSLQRIIMTTPYSIADSLRQAIENSGYDIISAQEYYIKTDKSEIIDEKRNYHIWNENISIDKLKTDNYQLLLGTERERIGLGDLDRTIYLNFSMPSSKIKSKNIFFAGIRGWQNFMYMFKEQLNTLEYIKYQNQ